MSCYIYPDINHKKDLGGSTPLLLGATPVGNVFHVPFLSKIKTINLDITLLIHKNDTYMSLILTFLVRYLWQELIEIFKFDFYFQYSFK
jgi:hypothetical protein